MQNPRAQSPKPEAQSPELTARAYLDALKLLARRELSEAQVRQRLARKGHLDAEIDAAVERLRAERAIDDARVAEALAHADVSARRRGRRRIVQHIEQAGIAPATARRAVDAVFDSVDDDALLETSLAKRLRGRLHVSDERELARLYRYLVGQGFEPDRVLSTLKRRRRPR